MPIRIGIFGYGNLGRGVECAIKQNQDTELAAVFTRRDPQSVSIKTTNVPVYHAEDAAAHVDDIDVMILCGGSATDLPIQTPTLVQHFNVVDSFDTHANIPTHFEEVDKVAKLHGNIGIISVGWDPGMFSLSRVFAHAVLPEGSTHTFWGKGVSQGHSDAIRRIEGVADARQYTIPVDAALHVARTQDNVEFTTREKHTRECYIVCEEGADCARIENEIVTMPHYFSDYDTTVYFISQEELDCDHKGIPHGGFVIHNGKTGWDGEYNNIIEYSLQLDSNPAFTASILLAYARAAFRMSLQGDSGAKTVFDIAPSQLCPESAEDLRKNFL